jgi:hypothetical protein
VFDRAEENEEEDDEEEDAAATGAGVCPLRWRGVEETLAGAVLPRRPSEPRQSETEDHSTEDHSTAPVRAACGNALRLWSLCPADGAFASCLRPWEALPRKAVERDASFGVGRSIHAPWWRAHLRGRQRTNRSLEQMSNRLLAMGKVETNAKAVATPLGRLACPMAHQLAH